MWDQSKASNEIVLVHGMEGWGYPVFFAPKSKMAEASPRTN